MRCAPILLLALFIGCAGPQQTAGVDDAAAPAKAQTVTVTTGMEPDEAYRTLASELQRRGFSLRSSDATLRSVTTDGQTMSEGGFVYELRMAGSVSAEGRTTVRAWYRVPSFDDTERPVEKTGMEGSVPRRAWAHLHGTAETLGTDPVYD